MCSRLTAIWRQQNVCGSLARDIEEGDLNDADFPDLYLGGAGMASGEYGGARAAKNIVFRVDACERACLDNAITELERNVDRGVVDAIKMFVEVTDRLWTGLHCQGHECSRMIYFAINRYRC